MAEKPKNTKPVAAERRKAADQALNDRIAARQKAASEKKPQPTAKEAMAAANPLPFVPSAPAIKESPKAKVTGAEGIVSSTNPMSLTAKPKKERKPREAKPKAEPSADLTAMLDKVREKAVAGASKAHKAELKKLQAEHKAELKKLTEDHKAILKGTVDKSTHDNEVKKAHEAGLKAGEKRAHAAIKAALKGGA